MTDKLTPEQRHNCMSRIRSKDTKPELTVRRFLFSHGYRFRIHVHRLPGTPDIVMRKYHVAIFVNGCFWHGHTNCNLYVTPKSNTDFWQNKIERNKSRDERVTLQLRKMGWHVIRIWECQLTPKNRQQYLTSLLYTLNTLMLTNLGARINPHPYETDDTPSQYAAETPNVESC